MIINAGRARVRSTLVVLAAAALTVTAAVTVVAGPPNAVAGSLVAAAPVEDEGLDCPVSEPGPLTANAKLPDPFRKLDGARIATRSEWRCRRAEIRKLAERYVYGTKPGRPATVTGTVSSTGITVSATDNGRTAGFSAGVQLPSGPGPFPAVVVVGGLGADTATIRAAGVAVISYDPLAVGKEGTARTSKQGAFYSIYGASSGTGLLAAWAWGVSRIIDVVERSGGSLLKADAMGVTGCSRYGKGAFAIGAFDQRIALTMPIESGSGGLPIFRGIPGESGAQPLSSAYAEQPWLGDAFGSFTGNPATLPVDTHELAAMVAPRGLFVMENPHIAWLAARSGSVAALAGAEVYQALGVRENITYWSDVQDGTHCAVRPEWRDPLQQNLKKFLLRTGNDPGTIRISSKALGNLAEWRDWSTPTLPDGPTPPPTTPPPTTAPPTTAPPTTAPPTTVPPTTTPPTTAPPTTDPPTGPCTATYRTVNAWSGGFQGEMTVRAGAAAITSWTVSWTLGGGQSVTQVWNGTLSTSGSAATVHNASWNGLLAPNAVTTFGFLANGTPSAPSATCASP
ncbi:cellulose binding domain-containing protein [Micromonospora sp. NPDC049836]|uniref:glucuronyl esterase domain-containing protein n=1 Tax=Micromonospora sp. NPDC049836 TaxID=3364274 RepID=UPI0037B07780